MFIVPTEADLDGSAEMISFMWLAIGNDPSSVTTDGMTIVRTLLAQNFAQLPLELQMLFGNGQSSNSAIQTAWNSAQPMVRMMMAQQFQRLLAILGLVPAGGEAQWGGASCGEQSLNSDIAANIAWKSSGAGDWSSR
ncbi:MAG: hypothetical protein WAV20_07735 [Blastocatellia bacterium]